MGNNLTAVTSTELQNQITRLDEKVDNRHKNSQEALGDLVTKMDTLIELNFGQKPQAQLIGQVSKG
ncbi:hypothetical protein ACMX25_26835 [Caballeronia sp. 15715]|uniref:hypothetical protein n=1 Tax=Caballeronia sp. 15715 TaxID=3391030 RepID=UPI0039E2263A